MHPGVACSPGAGAECNSTRQKRGNLPRLSLRQRGFDGLRRVYRGLIDWLLRLRYLLVVVFAGVLAYALMFAYQSMDFVMFPSSTAERFVINMRTPVGMSLQATSDQGRGGRSDRDRTRR